MLADRSQEVYTNICGIMPSVEKTIMILGKKIMLNQSVANITHKEKLGKMLASAIKEHGENGETANFIRQQIAEIDDAIVTDAAVEDAAKKSIPTTIEGTLEKGMVLYVVLGMVIIFVMLGFSSLFFGLLAAKWDMV